ncbi:hypothetical protein D3C78_1111510 [compost metagenome]
MSQPAHLILAFIGNAGIQITRFYTYHDAHHFQNRLRKGTGEDNPQQDECNQADARNGNDRRLNFSNRSVQIGFRHKPYNFTVYKGQRLGEDQHFIALIDNPLVVASA